MNQPKPKRLLTAGEIEIRIWAFVIVSVVMILTFIVVAIIYRTTFVQQPMKTPSQMDQMDQKMLNDIVLLLVGVISGVGLRKGVKEAAEMIAAVQKPVTPAYQNPMMGAPMPTMGYGAGSMMNNYTMPQNNYTVPPPVVVDVNWTPPPGPTNPPHHLEDTDERQALAAARESTRGQ